MYIKGNCNVNVYEIKDVAQDTLLGTYHKEPFINYVVSEGGAQESLILCNKNTTKREEGVRNRRFLDNVAYGRPLMGKRGTTN